MRLQHLVWSVLVAAVLLGLGSATVVLAAGKQFIPLLVTREGGQRSLQIPRSDGIIAYLTLLNTRDGGINGVTLVWEECETVFDVPRGIDCYEGLKAKGPVGAAALPMHSTPLVYALTERAAHDKIPLITAGIGRADAADGRVFPYVFNPPTTYWSMNTAKLRFLGQRVGGMAQLKGRKIAHVHQDSAYGRETIPILDRQAAQYGFTVQHLAVQVPGLDQKAIWLRVKVFQPDWVILRTGGIMTSTALKEAAQVGVPHDKIVGAAPTCAEQDVVPAGEAARGFICVTFLGTGTDFPVIREIRQNVYARGQGPGPEGDIGTDRWKRGVVDAVFVTEGIRRGMREFGHQPLTGAQVQWGLEHLTLTEAALKELGLEGLISPISLSCHDHEGGASVKFQQWDGTQWNAITDWIATDQALVRPLVEASAAKYAQEKGITPRACP